MWEEKERACCYRPSWQVTKTSYTRSIFNLHAQLQFSYPNENENNVFHFLSFYKETRIRKAFREWHQWKCARFRNQQSKPEYFQKILLHSLIMFGKSRTSAIAMHSLLNCSHANLCNFQNFLIHQYICLGNTLTPSYFQRLLPVSNTCDKISVLMFLCVQSILNITKT